MVGNGLPVEFQQDSEQFSQWRSKDIMAQKEKFDDKNPASYAQTLLMKLNFSDGTGNGAPKGMKAPGQGPCQKAKVFSSTRQTKACCQR